MTDLSEPQAAMMSFLRDFASKNGYAPTRREIADGLGYKSGNAAHELLLRLERKGLVRIDKNQSRSIHVIDSTVTAPLALASISGEDFRLTRVREAICERNPGKAYSLLIGNAEKFADAFIADTLPSSKNAQFLLRHLSFVESHLTTLFTKIEGRGAAKKTAAAIRILTSTFLPGESSNTEESILDIEIVTGKTFQVQSELFRFFEAIKNLHGGCGGLYFEFMWNHRPSIKMTLSSLKAKQTSILREKSM
jgi:repressor LexA